MSDFFISITFIVMLSFLFQVGADLELMGELRLLVDGRLFCFLDSIVMLSFLFRSIVMLSF